MCASRQNPFGFCLIPMAQETPDRFPAHTLPFRRKYARSKHSFGIVVPLVSSVTGGPVPAYISAGGSKAVTVPAPADAAFSPWRHLSEALPGQRPFLSLFQNGNNIALASAVVKGGAPAIFTGNFRQTRKFPPLFIHGAWAGSSGSGPTGTGWQTPPPRRSAWPPPLPPGATARRRSPPRSARRRHKYA